MIGVGDFQISGKLFFRFESEFGDRVVLFGQFDGGSEVSPENIFLRIFASIFILQVFQVADTMFVPFVFTEGVIVVDTPLRPVGVELG